MDKLSEHYEEYDKMRYEVSERLRDKYINKYPLPDVYFMETARIRTQSKDWYQYVVYKNLNIM